MLEILGGERSHLAVLIRQRSLWHRVAPLVCWPS
jgi:hypothetical protein